LEAAGVGIQKIQNPSMNTSVAEMIG